MTYQSAIKDVIAGAKQYEYWTVFGMNDIKAKYRRSKIGQWWITLSVATFIFVIGGLYRGIFDADSGTYLVYLAVGYITWLFIQDSVNLGCMIIIQAKSVMMQQSWPISTFVYRLIYREILIFAHHIILVPLILIWVGLWPGFGGILLSFLGFILVVFTAFWVAMLLAIISLRYRDFPPIAQSVIRVAFFATPVIWIERNLGTFGEWVVLLNPFGYFLKIVRDPILGYGFPTQAWLVAISISLVTMLISIMTIAFTKKRISYWL